MCLFEARLDTFDPYLNIDQNCQNIGIVVPQLYTQ